MRLPAVAIGVMILVASTAGASMALNYQIAPVYQGLRKQILSLKPDSLGIADKSTIMAVLMETGFREAAVTLVSVADGSASLYFSNGGGIIGAGKHDVPRRESLQMLIAAQQHLPLLKTVSEFPVPAVGHTRFYVVTGAGVYSADAREEDLGNNRHKLSALFMQGHRLITAIREIQEK